MLDQIRQTEIGEQLESDDPAIESEPESDSNPQASSSDSEEGPITVAPIWQPVAKTRKKAKAKVADTGDISGDDDGMVPTPIYCHNL